MIHEIDFLDIVSFLIKDDMPLVVSKKELYSIKRKIESTYYSVEVDVDNFSIERFKHKYQDCVVLKESKITITMSSAKRKELHRLRSSYMEDKIKKLLEDE